MTPSSDNLGASQASLCKSHTRLNEILGPGDPTKPSITINGSTQSVKKLIEATEPKETRNGSAITIIKGRLRYYCEWESVLSWASASINAVINTVMSCQVFRQQMSTNVVNKCQQMFRQQMSCHCLVKCFVLCCYVSCCTCFQCRSLIEGQKATLSICDIVIVAADFSNNDAKIHVDPSF